MHGWGCKFSDICFNSCFESSHFWCGDCKASACQFTGDIISTRCVLHLVIEFVCSLDGFFSHVCKSFSEFSLSIWSIKHWSGLFDSLGNFISSLLWVWEGWHWCHVKSLSHTCEITVNVSNNTGKLSNLFSISCGGSSTSDQILNLSLHSSY